MSKPVWLYGNTDGDGLWNWSLDEDQAFAQATAQLRHEMDKRNYNEADGWVTTTTVSMPGHGRRVLTRIARRGNRSHLHKVEIHRCSVITENANHLVLLVPMLRKQAIIDKHPGYTAGNPLPINGQARRR